MDLTVQFAATFGKQPSMRLLNRWKFLCCFEFWRSGLGGKAVRISADPATAAAGLGPLATLNFTNACTAPDRNGD
jgi:hypothetical protein